MKRTRPLKLQLIARPGYAPTAVAFPPDRGYKGTFLDREFERATLAKRLLGAAALKSEGLSGKWESEVYCVPEFGRWWVTQPLPPPREFRIFLEVLRA